MSGSSFTTSYKVKDCWGNFSESTIEEGTLTFKNYTSKRASIVLSKYEDYEFFMKTSNHEDDVTTYAWTIDGIDYNKIDDIYDRIEVIETVSVLNPNRSLDNLKSWSSS